MSRIPARLSRLESGAPDCTAFPELPELATLGALMDTPDPTNAEQRTLMYARLESLLTRVWPRAMGGDVTAAGLALRLIDRQTDLLGLTKPDPDSMGEAVTTEDLMRLIERSRATEADTGR